VYYLVSCNLAEILIIFLPTALGRWVFPLIVPNLVITPDNYAPLTAIQLLWLNLVTDGAPALALGTEKGDPDIMDQKPRPPQESIINRDMRIGLIVQTIAISSVVLVAFMIGLRHDVAYAHTMAFATLSLSELIRAFTSRSERYGLFKIGVFSNKWMNIAVAASAALVFMVIYIPFFNPIFQTEPLTLTEWELVLPLLLVPSIAAEITKFFLRQAAKK
jgi:Ca2+-transporting ATPase